MEPWIVVGWGDRGCTAARHCADSDLTSAAGEARPWVLGLCVGFPAAGRSSLCLHRADTGARGAILPGSWGALAAWPPLPRLPMAASLRDLEPTRLIQGALVSGST